MTTDSDLLFVYGTLLINENELSKYLKHTAIFYTKGKINGKLYNAGEYPGAIPDANSGYFIYGDVYHLPCQQQAFSLLDAYEGYGNDQPQPNEFLRRLCEVETELGLKTCWVYFYNLRVAGLEEIRTGDYIGFLSRKHI
jgi:gamma-glutamylcyclotransferase (GGCT)/AIG2-like uncharacterized protein YtfP